MAPWTTDETVLDRINQLALVCRRNRHVAIYLSDPSWRAAVTRQFDVKGVRGVGALRRIPAGLLNAAFVKGSARTLWLSGIHRPSSVKADNKILSGIDLRDALDPLNDQTYFFTAARCLPGIPSFGLPVGVSPRGSRIWAGATNLWSEFRATVSLLLRHLESVTTPEEAPLPVVAVPSADAGKIAGAFDVGLLPPEILDDSTTTEEERQELEKWAYHTEFEVVDTAGPDLKANLTLDGTLLGTVEFSLDLSTPDHIKWQATGDCASAAVKVEHAAALAACNRSGWVKIWYESGHTLSNGAIFEERFRDLPFENFKFVDFGKHFVKQEKPKNLDLSHIGKQKSLFCWVLNNWPIAGRSTGAGWLACNDGSMEIADFIHLDDECEALSLIHVKGAGSNDSERQISVSKYEVVVGQAVKNLRHLDRLLMAEGFTVRLSEKIKDLVWRDRSPVDRAVMHDALKNLKSQCDRRVIVLQPQVTKRRWDYARKNPNSPDAARLRQLNTLLLSASAACHGLRASFLVIGAK
jgi:hypothetical protein